MAAHRKRAASCHCFSCGALPILGGDEHFYGVGRPRPRPVHRHQGTLGAADDAPAIRRRMTARARGPWGEPPRRQRRTTISPGSSVSSLDELFRRGRARFGGGGGGFPGRPDRSLIVWAILGFILVWLVFTSFHSISPGQRGRCDAVRPLQPTLGPGVSFTLAVADRPGEEDRRREYPDDRSGLGRRRRSDADRRPESDRPRLFGALEHPHARSSICSRWRSRTRPSARSRKARCARW